MSRSAYDRVRAAADGTALAGRMESLNTELHLTPESPEWTIAALTLIGSQRLSEDLATTVSALQNLAVALPDSMRQAATEIVRGLAQDVARETAESTRAAVVEVIRNDMQELVQASGEHLRKSLGAFEHGVANLRAQHDKSAGEAIHASNQLRSVAADVRQSWRDLQGHTFIIAIGICLFLVVASAGIAWKLTWDRAYHAGAYVERAAIMHREAR